VSSKKLWKSTKAVRLSSDDEKTDELDLESLLSSTVISSDSSNPFESLQNTKGVEVDENRIYFYTSVTEREVLELNKILRHLDVEMRCLALRLKAPNIPIELHIHSPGGDLFSGLAAVDVIQSIKTPVHTYVEGSAASAATLMSIVGNKRYMYKNSFMLIHQISSVMVHGTHEQFKDELENQQMLMDRIKEIYKTKTDMPPETVEELLVHDLWLNSETCLEYGLVDKIL